MHRYNFSGLTPLLCSALNGSSASRADAQIEFPAQSQQQGFPQACTTQRKNAMMYVSSKFASRSLWAAKAKHWRESKKRRAVHSFSHPWMLLVSAVNILLLFCRGDIPIPILGSAHSCFLSEGVNYISGRLRRS